MSTSLSPKASGSAGHPTRQQLDELDALLQRMLALPVNQADDEVTAEIKALPKTAATMRQEPVSYRTTEHISDDKAASSASPRQDAPHVDAPTEGQEDGDNWVPLSSTWKPSPHTWKPLAQSWQQPRALPPVQEPAMKSEVPVERPPVRAAAAEPAPQTTLALPVEQAPPVVAFTTTPSADEPPLAGWLVPLVWFNIAFDVFLMPWGLPGRWLRRDGGGRTLLGVVGILMLVSAIGVGSLEWFGWTWSFLLARIW